MSPAALAQNSAQAAQILARLDRLPATRHVWQLVVLLSLGAAFEIYDLILTAYVSPGLIRSGIFSDTSKGFFGLTDQATFASATFAGLFVGTLFFAQVADRFGRRTIFTFSLLWYAAATVVMAAQNTAIEVDLWRFIAGIGIAVELVTVDTYIAELVPKAMRGKAFAVNAFIQFCAVPLVALLAWLLVPHDPLGMAGWRWVVLVPALGAVAIWWIRLAVPESPRWLATHGRLVDAEQATAALETRVRADLNGPLPEPAPPVFAKAGKASFDEIWRPPFRRRTLMLIVFNVFQTIGYYGFNNWVPALMAAQGANITQSLRYSFIVATASPLSPLLFTLFADRFERKWQIVAAAIGIAVSGLLFARQSRAGMLICFGVLITLFNQLLSYSFHAYQAELFPTRVRARAVGFVYSFSRLSTVFSSFLIAFFLQNFGTAGVFGFIAGSMMMVVLSIGVFGPATRGLALEEISH
jgi:putative MFS transporter